MVNVIVEARNDVDNPGVVKLQGEAWELNVWATTDELWKLAGIEKTDWVQRRTLQVGRGPTQRGTAGKRTGCLSRELFG
jgi:hypothetical protein